MQSTTLSQLSMSYFPNTSRSNARRLFNDMLKKNKDLQQALTATFFNPAKHYLTPTQLELIYYYLGEP